MRYVKVLAPALVAAFVCCASVTAGASAEGGPLWAYCKYVGLGGSYDSAHCEGSGSEWEEHLLSSPSETLLLAELQLNTQELLFSANEYSINCSTLRGHGHLLGGHPGTALEELTYSSCSLPNKPKCNVSTGGGPLGTIKFNQLEGELVYLTEAAAKSLDPDESGTRLKEQGGNTFVTFELHPLTAGACPFNGNGALKGEVLLENDEPLAHLLVHTVLAPVTSIKAFYLGITGQKDEIKELNIAGLEAVLAGDISLAVSELGSEAPVGSWLCP